MNKLTSITKHTSKLIAYIWYVTIQDGGLPTISHENNLQEMYRPAGLGPSPTGPST